MEQPRTQAALAFLANGLALLSVTVFAIVGGVEPLLRSAAPQGAEVQAVIEALYPFEGANAVRLAYGIACLLPVLLPILSGKRLAAWLTLLAGLLITAVNIQDAVAQHLLAGETLFGVVFIVSIGLPSLLGIRAAVAWIRRPA